MTAPALQSFRTGETPLPDIVILTHKLTRAYDMGGEVVRALQGVERVAIARALVNEPSILLADEPTGNLDSTTSAEIMAVFRDLHRQGQTIVMVTHEHDIAAHAARVVTLRDGVIASDQRRAA